jgi:hypothetical protein
MSVKAAAAETGVGLRTLHRWLADPSFRVRVDRLREELFSEVAGRLSSLGGRATETLGELLVSKDDKVRLQTARAILESASSFRQMTELSARLSALEQRASEGDNT